MRKRGGEISSPLAYEEVDAIATIVELVREVVEPVIQAPFELVDIEYGKIGSDMILSIFVDKPEGITLNDTADLTEIISPVLDTIKPDPFPEQYFLEITSPGLERPLKTKEAVTGAVISRKYCSGKGSGLIVSRTGLIISVKSAVSFKVIPSGLSTKILRIMSLPIFPYSISTSSKGASITGSTTSLTNSTIVAIASTSS